MSEAKAIINGTNLPKDKGEYIVSFEVREGGVLRGDHFPDIREGEKSIKGLENAWTMARNFASAMYNKNVVNVYVCYGSGPNRFVPVPGYDSRKLNRYSGRYE